MKSKFNIGDKVTIIDDGKLYSTYESMAKVMQLKQWLPGNYAAAYVGHIGTVVAVQKHLDAERILCGVQFEDGMELIMGEDGLTSTTARDHYKTLWTKRISLNEKRTINYRINKIRLAKQMNEVFPGHYTYMETKVGNVVFIEDIYFRKGRRMVRYTTEFKNGRKTYNETTMDNLLHRSEFKYFWR